MRFHFGVSFRLKTIKKFLFPILIGLLTYFFSSYINLGVVHAQTNLDTSYTLELQEIDFTQYNVFTDMNIQEFLDSITSNFVYSTHDLLVQFFYRNGSYTVYVYLIPHQSNLQYTIYGYQTNLMYGHETSINNMIFWYFNPNQSYTSSNSTNYQRLLSCLKDATTCTPTNTVQGNTGNNTINTFYEVQVTTNYKNFDNDNSYNLGSLSNYGYIYYSSNSLVYNTNFYSSSITYFVKTLTLNNINITNQDDLPTYYDLFKKEPDSEPDPEPNPDESGKTMYFSKYVYWFGEHDSTDEILENIYVLLFLSFSGIFFLKCISIIKNTRW